MVYDYVLVLRFDSAGIFSKYWIGEEGSKISASKDDRILYYKSRNRRVPSQWIEQQVGTIYYGFIANVIRVLCGARPISRYRPTCVISYGNFEEIAKRSLVRIDNATYVNSKGEAGYITEQMTTRKCLEDSWSSAYPSWVRFKYLLPDELYSELVCIANDICQGNAEEMLFDTVADILYKSKDIRVAALAIKASNSKCEPLAKLLTGSKVHSLHQAGYQGLGPYLKTLVLKGVSKVVRLEGSICIPVFAEELELFRGGSGVATIFDGGAVRIDRVYDLKNTTLEMVTAGHTQAQQ